MRTVRSSLRPGLVTIASVAIGVALAVLVPALSAAAPAPQGEIPATGPYQWAFGGSVSTAYSCTGATCPNGTATTNQTQSLSWNITLQWAAVFTQTNVSSTQTEYQGKTALGLSVSFGYSACVTISPCSLESVSLSAHGHFTANGVTNVSSAGTVYLSAGSGSPGLTPALAIMNAASNKSFNISGSVAETLPSTMTDSLSASYVVGGSESSSITFPKAPLGIVPTDPSPGQFWNTTEPYSAGGSYSGGYSLTATVNGTTATESHWSPGSVAATGDLAVNGTDAGTTTLYDNYTTPHTTITAQEIELTFASGNFSISDCWILASSALYDGLLSSFSAAAPAQVVGLAALPSQSLSSNLTSEESAFYAAGSGFVGASEAGNTSGLGGVPNGPKLAVSAGPEPVSVAQGQLGSITSSSSSSGSGFPLLLVVGVVVAAVVVVGAVLVVRGRSSRRRPPTPYSATIPGGVAAPTAPAEPGTMPPPTGGGAV